MKRKLILGVLLATALPAAISFPPAVAAKPAQATATLSMPHRVVRMENGLTLVLMPDETLPNVGVELWIRGGAREERAGQFGIAHLFEHQIAGSPAGRVLSNRENRALLARSQRGGGAGTDLDFVNFYRMIAPEGLEVTLATLADQFDPRGPGFTGDRLKTDKDIVVSELRRNFTLPWNTDLMTHLQLGTFGPEHPYGHAVVGSEADVRAATVPLMREWLSRFGGAASATLFIVGNFDPPAAEAMARRYFGPLAAGTRYRPVKRAIPRPTGLRETLEVPFPVGGVFLQWPTPAWGSEDGDRLALLSRVLEDRLRRAGAAKAAASVQLWELAGSFSVTDEASTLAGAAEAEARLSAALRRLLETGPTAAELDRARAQWKTEFLLSLQNPVWRGSRSEAVGRGLLSYGDPDRYRVRMAQIAAATPKQVQAAGARWLGRPGYVLHALPVGATAPAAAAAVPVQPGPTLPPGPSREPRLAAIESKRLAAGGKLVVAARPELPLARVTIAFPAGVASDSAGAAGRARVVLAALPNIALRSGGTLAEGIAQLGGRLETRIDPDFASLSFTVVAEQLESGLAAVLGALAAGPADADFARALGEQQAEAAAARTDPSASRWGVAACMLVDPCNPALLDGLGREATLRELSSEQLRSFYKSRYNGTNALVIVSGAAQAERLAPVVEAALPPGPQAPADAVLQPQLPVPRVRIIDAPGAAQANLLLVQPLPSGLAADPIPAELATLTFRQRLMNVLRTEKGWSYEMYPYGNRVGRSGSFLFMNIPIQTDKAGLGIKEVEAEAERLRKAPVDPGFFTFTKGYLQGALLRGLTSLDSMNEQLLEAERGSLPAGYHSKALRAVPAVSAEEVRAQAQSMLAPDRFLWVIAGDLKRLGPVLDAEKIPYTVVKSVP
ncbi:MAG TPA: insulinase family protein [Allosphingosinicella sp.]|jgi:predicted Zn-dependent peptidase